VDNDAVLFRFFVTWAVGGGVDVHLVALARERLGDLLGNAGGAGTIVVSPTVELLGVRVLCDELRDFE